MTTPSDQEFVLPKIKSEEDVPPRTSDVPIVQEVPKRDVDDIEKRMDRRMERQLTYMDRTHPYLLKDRAHRLIIICLITILAIYFGDIIVVNLGGKNSALADNITELLKLIITTSLGFVFSQYASKKD